MIKALHIGNFKAFSATQTVPIRPITLIFGANSAGKSSIIHSLALVHDASENGDLDIEQTDIGGESIDLGGFVNYVHRRDTSRQVEWAVDIDAEKYLAQDNDISTIRLSFLIGKRQTGGYGITRFAILADEQPVVTMSHREGEHLRIDQIELQHTFFAGALSDEPTIFSRIRSEIGRASAQLDLTLLRGDVEQFFPGISADRSGMDADQLATDLQELTNIKEDGHIPKSLTQFFGPMLAELAALPLDRLTDHARKQLQRLHYLGPLRSYPPRRFALSSQQDNNWYAGGGHTWDILREDAAVRAAVNEWLQSPQRLSTPYQLVTHDLLSLRELDAPLRIALGNLRAAADHSIHAMHDELPLIEDTDTAAEYVLQQLAGADMERHTEIALRDRRTNALLSHRDVGIGISQIMPVLVHAMSLREQLIAIEQPEIHIHPRLQAELGDVFINSALGEQRNRFLLETHSEHLILRILRRIRQTAEGGLPTDVAAIQPEDVAVLYVEPGERGAEVIEIPVTPDGDFARRWPNGFFADRIEEMM